MANLSTARGKFCFEKSFVEKHGDLLQNWIDKYESTRYGFELIKDKLDSDGSIAFNAYGEWTYSDILKKDGIGWTDGNPEKMDSCGRASREAVMALAKALADEKSKVDVEYTDFEPGLMVLYEAHTTLLYKNESEFEVTEECNYDIDYNLNTICEKGLRCAAYDFNKEDDKGKFKEYVKEHFSEQLKRIGVEADTFSDKVAEMALADDFRKGIILKWENENFERLCSIADLNTVAAA